MDGFVGRNCQGQKSFKRAPNYLPKVIYILSTFYMNGSRCYNALYLLIVQLIYYILFLYVLGRITKSVNISVSRAITFETPCPPNFWLRLGAVPQGHGHQM